MILGFCTFSTMTLDSAIIAAYDQTRKKPRSGLICHAPQVSINFEQSGMANACCYNRSFSLGSYPENSVEEIWFGSSADELRTYMQRGDLSLGCQICQKQLESRNFYGTHARHFDDYPVGTDSMLKRFFMKKGSQLMPQCMEFELENTCNLECVMCNGHFSSSIRKNREQLPAMVSPYDDEFVTQLVPFLPYLKDAKFLGGEPFLIPIYYKIWEKIAQHNPNVLVHITTNGTVYNNRVRDLLDRMRVGIIMSIDSIEKETYLKIRSNSNYERVMQNIVNFREYTKKKRTWFSYAICPMTLNWAEIPSLVKHCNEHDTYAYFNTVFQPLELSIRSMSVNELERVVENYKQCAEGLSSKTMVDRHNRSAFLDLIKQIEKWYDDKLDFLQRQQLEEDGFSEVVRSVLEFATPDQRADIGFVEMIRCFTKTDQRPKERKDRSIFETDPNFVDPEEYQLIEREMNSWNEQIEELNSKVVDMIFAAPKKGAQTFGNVLVTYRAYVGGGYDKDGFSKKVNTITEWMSDNPNKRDLVRANFKGNATELVRNIDKTPLLVIRAILSQV